MAKRTSSRQIVAHAICPIEMAHSDRRRSNPAPDDNDRVSNPVGGHDCTCQQHAMERVANPTAAVPSWKGFHEAVVVEINNEIEKHNLPPDALSKITQKDLEAAFLRGDDPNDVVQRVVALYAD